MSKIYYPIKLKQLGKLVNIKMKKLKMNLILEKKQLILIVVYVSVKDDDGQETICKTEELKLARFGRQIVRVFGPLKIQSWEAFGTRGSVVYKALIKLRDVDLSATERLMPFPGLNQSANTIADKYEVKIKDAATFADRNGNFDAEYKRETRFFLSTTFQERHNSYLSALPLGERNLPRIIQYLVIVVIIRKIK